MKNHLTQAKQLASILSTVGLMLLGTGQHVNGQTAEGTASQAETTTVAKAPSQASSSIAKQSTETTAPKKFDLSFDDLTFEMEKGGDFERTMLTEKINSYHGNTIKIRGFIRPSFSQSGLTKFIFVRDNKECCFGPGAAIFDCILVRLKKGLETDYTVRPVTIEGKFALKTYHGPDGKVWSIYRMTDTVVR